MMLSLDIGGLYADFCEVGLAVGLLLVGRLSDIFGRRWFFIGGTILGAIGAAVAGTAKTIPGTKYDTTYHGYY
jgi:MFS family permease